MITRRLSILDRYLFKQFTGPFVLAVGAFALIGIVDILMFLAEQVISKGIPIFITIKLLVYKLPAIMVLFFPMAVLFATMLLLVRMAKDNELTILRVSGISTYRILTPLFIMLTTTVALSFMFNEKIVPWTNRASDGIIRKELSKSPPFEILENVVFKVGKNRHFYIKEIDSEKKEMFNIVIFEDTHRFPRITTAETAIWNDKTWTLYTGQIYDMQSDGNLTFHDRFESLKIHVDQDIRNFYKRHKSSKEMDSKELRDRIHTLKKGGISTRALQVEYYLKFSIPFACFIFGLIGMAFSLSFVRSGKDWWGVIIAIIIAVLVVGLYFFLVAIFRALGKDGQIVPFLAAWFPNILYAILGLGLITYQSLKK